MEWNNKLGYIRYTKSLEMLKFLLGIYAVDIYDMRKELYPYNTAILEYLTTELVYLGETSEMKERVEKILELFEEGAQLIISDRAKELAELIGIDTSEITISEPEPEDPNLDESEDETGEENNNEDDVVVVKPSTNSGTSGGGIIVPPVIAGENDEFLAPLGSVLLSDDALDFGNNNTEATEIENPDEDSDEDEGAEDEDTGKIGWRDIPGWYEIEYDQDRFIFCWTNVMTALCVRLKFQYAHLFSDIYDGECCKCGAKGQTTSDYEAWTSGVYPEDEMYDRMLYYRNHTAWGTTKVSDVDCTCHRKQDTDTGED